MKVKVRVRVGGDIGNSFNHICEIRSVDVMSTNVCVRDGSGTPDPDGVRGGCVYRGRSIADSPTRGTRETPTCKHSNDSCALIYITSLLCLLR